MLAEIYFLRLETVARAAAQRAPANTPRYVAFCGTVKAPTGRLAVESTAASLRAPALSPPDWPQH